MSTTLSTFSMSVMVGVTIVGAVVVVHGYCYYCYYYYYYLGPVTWLIFADFQVLLAMS